MSLRRVELRSDTFTRPTESMRRAMYEAEVGDDVWNEDPTVRALEELAAEVTGFEAALFVTSGTQGNLVGLLCHTSRGDEVIVGDQSHIFWYEVAGTAVVGGLQLRPLPDGAGCLSPSDIERAIREVDVHNPRTGCLALENTHNRCGGAVMTRDQTRSLAGIAHAAGVPVHLDGARIFNAASALGLPVSHLASYCDSLSFCLSKCLGAPVGSMLCGSGAFIDQARGWRKMLGGGMRQVGILAAAGIVALTENVDRLVEDHENARFLAEGLANVRNIEIDVDRVQSNMVYFTCHGAGFDLPASIIHLGEMGVHVSESTDMIRAVTSYEVSRADIEYALQAISHLVTGVEATPA